MYIASVILSVIVFTGYMLWLPAEAVRWPERGAFAAVLVVISILPLVNMLGCLMVMMDIRRGK